MLNPNLSCTRRDQKPQVVKFSSRLCNLKKVFTFRDLILLGA
jgi:hypothetical protein